MPATRKIFEDVYEVARLIPFGRATSYGAIARYLGINARTVGWAMNSLPTGHDVPAHRVVNTKGILTGAAAFARLLTSFSAAAGLMRAGDFEGAFTCAVFGGTTAFGPADLLVAFAMFFLVPAQTARTDAKG